MGSAPTRRAPGRLALRLGGVGVLVASGIGVALATAELAARGVEWFRERPASVVGGLDPSRRGLPELVGFEIAQPNVRGIHFGVLHRTNSHGVRGPEYTPQPEAGSFRIVVVGDSWVMGHRVEEESAYPARLQAMLAARIPEQRFEVINAGLSALNIGGVVERLKRIGLPYSPHLVVYGFTPNDIYGAGYLPNSEAERQAFRALMERHARSPSHLLRLVWPRWIALRSALRPLPGSYEFALRHNYLERPLAFAKIERGLAALAGLSVEHDVCVHVLIHPVIHQLDFLHPYRSIYQRVEEAARRHGLGVTQALPTFLGRRASELHFGRDDNHPNAEGHRLLAKALAGALAGLPERCGMPLELREAPPGPLRRRPQAPASSTRSR